MYLVRDLKRKKHVILEDNELLGFFVRDSKDFEILFEFEPRPFPDLKCSDCGVQNDTVKEREDGNGVQCYQCYKDDKYFEDEYK